jgi:hypothetical protein
VHVNVVGYAGPGSFAKVQAHVEATWLVDFTQGEFSALREEHQLVGSLGWNRSERRQVLIGHDHHMAGGVGVCVEADKAVQAPVDDMGGPFGGLASHAVGDGVIDRSDHVAEDTVLVLGLRRGPGAKCRGHTGSRLRVGVGDVTVAPRRPEAIHSPSISGQTEAAPGWCGGKVNYFRCDDSWDGSLHPIRCESKKIHSAGDDVAMKMHAPGLAFVDGLYPKFYSLSSEPLRVGPKAMALLARPDSFHPADAVAGREKAASVRSRIADCSRPMRRLRENGSLDPGVRIHHGRKP